MTRLRIRRGGGTDRGAAGGPGQDVLPVASPAQLASTTLAARAVSVVLGVCVAAGPAALGVALAARPAPPSQPVAVAAGEQDPGRDRAAAHAQRVVVAWLRATQDKPGDLPELAPNMPRQLPEKGFGVANPVIAGAELVNGIWSVTVAADVADARGSARRYYQVPVAHRDGAVAALSLPAMVPPPPAADPPRDGYSAQAAPTGPLGSAVAQFLAAYLTGSGEVSRYLSPDTTLTAVDPAPFAAIRVDLIRTDLRDVGTAAAPAEGTRARVMATVTGTVTEAQHSTLTYTLTLTARSGRWEVTAIDPAPALGPQTPTTPAPETSSPPTAASTPTAQ